MRRISSLSVLCLAAGIMSACSLPDEVITTEDIPTAGVRFINAVPDTNLVDMRFYDLVESNAHFRIAFRSNPVTTGGVPASTAVQYKGARAGTRKFRVFLDDTAQAVASVVLLDTTFAFDQGKNYTVMMWGNARSAGADKMRFDIWEEAVPAPAATDVALRLINATTTAIDGYQYLSTGAIGAASWTGLAGRSLGAYVTVPITTGTQTRRFQVRAAGGATPITTCPDASALTGAVATADLEPIPGTGAGSSALSGIVFPGSIAGTKAAQFTTSTGSVNQLATVTGFEAARSYITDGFCAGMTVVGTGFSAGNNASAVIAAVADGATTGSLPGSGSTLLTASPGGVYTRSAGDFTANGFAVGQNVTVAGFTTSGNNGTAVITGLTPTVMTTTRATTQEAGSSGSISISVVANTLGATGGVYRRAAGSWLTDGFVVGQALNATGFAAAVGATPSNNGASTVTALSADGLDMTVSKATGMANEAAAAGRTISTTANRTIIGFGRMDIVGGRTAQAAAGSRTLTVTPPPPGITFVWDRRPPRTACSPLC